MPCSSVSSVNTSDLDLDHLPDANPPAKRKRVASEKAIGCVISYFSSKTKPKNKTFEDLVEND